MTEIGLKWFCVILVGLSLLAVSQVHAAPTSTQRFIASLTDELEAKVIGDDELVVLIESADAGHVANPICETTAALSTERLLAYEVFQGYIDAGDLDAAAIAAWARENLVDSERVRARRNESRKETEQPWKERPTLLSSAGYYTCAVNVDGFVQCWGDNSHGQTIPPKDLGVVRSVSCGHNHCCAVTADQELKCWGYGKLGQLEIPADLGAVESVSAGSSYTCAVKSDRTVRCWGLIDMGIAAFVPPDLGLVQSISCGATRICALRADSLVQCWGSHYYGQLIPPEDLGIVSLVSAGGIHACAVKIDGSVKCWGDNELGQSTPADLGAVLSVSAGDHHSCAVKADGSVQCWGANLHGQSTSPSDLASVRSISAGAYHTCAVKADGTVKCWGEDKWGFVPDGLIVKSSGSKP